MRLALVSVLLVGALSNTLAFGVDQVYHVCMPQDGVATFNNETVCLSYSGASPIVGNGDVQLKNLVNNQNKTSLYKLRIAFVKDPSDESQFQAVLVDEDDVCLHHFDGDSRTMLRWRPCVTGTSDKWDTASFEQAGQLRPVTDTSLCMTPSHCNARRDNDQFDNYVCTNKDKSGILKQDEVPGTGFYVKLFDCQGATSTVLQYQSPAIVNAIQTAAPTSSTLAPTTTAPTLAPSVSPTSFPTNLPTASPTTSAPTTSTPTTAAPTTSEPTTPAPTTPAPTTSAPTTSEPTTSAPTGDKQGISFGDSTRSMTPPSDVEESNMVVMSIIYLVILSIAFLFSSATVDRVAALKGMASKGYSIVCSVVAHFDFYQLLLVGQFALAAGTMDLAFMPLNALYAGSNFSYVLGNVNFGLFEKPDSNLTEALQNNELSGFERYAVSVDLYPNDLLANSLVLYVIALLLILVVSSMYYALWRMCGAPHYAEEEQSAPSSNTSKFAANSPASAGKSTDPESQQNPSPPAEHHISYLNFLDGIGNRFMYYTSYPIFVLSFYQFYYVANLSTGKSYDKWMAFAGAFFLVLHLVYLVRTYVMVTKMTSEEWNTSNYSVDNSLRIARYGYILSVWRYEARQFFAVRVMFWLLNAIAIGALRGVAQPAVLFVSVTLYLAAVVVIKPHAFGANLVAVFWAMLFYVPISLYLICATNRSLATDDLGKGLMSAWAILILLLLLVVCASTVVYGINRCNGAKNDNGDGKPVNDDEDNYPYDSATTSKKASSTNPSEEPPSHAVGGEPDLEDAIPAAAATTAAAATAAGAGKGQETSQPQVVVTIDEEAPETTTQTSPPDEAATPIPASKMRSNSEDTILQEFLGTGESQPQTKLSAAAQADDQNHVLVA